MPTLLFEILVSRHESKVLLTASQVGNCIYFDVHPGINASFFREKLENKMC